MKKWKGCLLVIVAIICLFWIFPEQTPAASNSVIVSVEKSTLGQGFIVEINKKKATFKITVK